VWQQLRRRRVTRTVVTYLSVAFAVLEATWYLVPRFGLVEDVARLVTGGVVLGFPFAVVLAWTYDLTPMGIVRTPEDGVTESPEASRVQLAPWSWLLLCVILAVTGLVFRALRTVG
jgi:hypothetical protein